MRPPLSRLCAALAAALTGTLLTWQPTTAQAATSEPAFAITVNTLTPAVLPRRGSVVISGQITNTTSDTWRDLNVHLATSPTRVDSAAAITAGLDATDADVGLSRLQDPRAFVGLGDLAAKASATFRLSVPRAVLGIPKAPGTYWIGVHVLGTSPDGRDDVADGRIRMLITQPGRTVTPSRIALVAPVRASVRTFADGAPRRPGWWGRNLAESGRLGQVAAFVASGRADELTTVVDPAVLDLAAHLAAEATSPDDTADNTPSDSPSGGTDAATLSPDQAALAQTAGVWLNTLNRGLQLHRVLGLPYADPDVAALSHLDPRLLANAQTLTEDAMTRMALPFTPAALPPDGGVPDAALTGLTPRTSLLLRAPDQRPATYVTATGQALTFTTQAPDLPLLPLRQWLLAQASMRAGQPGTLVVTLPPRWQPGPAAPDRFFEGLRGQSLLSLTALPGPSQTWTAPLPYSASQASRELSAASVTSSRAVVKAGHRYATTMADAQAENHLGLALQTVSYWARTDESLAQGQAAAVRRSILDQLAGIRVVGRPFANMAGTSGTLLVTLINDLDVPVTVGLKAVRLSPGLKISQTDPVELQAHQRTTVRLSASTEALGVHQVVLSPVNKEGARVGTALEYTIRSSNVSRWIWAVMAGGAALLVGMIVRRLIKTGLKKRPGSDPW